MLTVSLTSIPPRFAGLGPCLEGLLAQAGVSLVVLNIPHRYARFPDHFELPGLPAGVELLRCEDEGPASKILPLARRSDPDRPILICDDDWLYRDGWAAGFSTYHTQNPNTALAASTFDATRLGSARHGTVAQGFAGVLITPKMLPPEAYTLPERYRSVDDVWLSGMLAYADTPITTLTDLRPFAVSSDNETAPLQDLPERATLNADCAAYLVNTFRVWV